TGTPRPWPRLPAAGPRSAVARPSPNTPSKASTPPPARKVSPMCPVRFVTYVSGRSRIRVLSWFAHQGGQVPKQFQLGRLIRRGRLNCDAFNELADEGDRLARGLVALRQGCMNVGHFLPVPLGGIGVQGNRVGLFSRHLCE